MMGLCSFKGSE